MVLTVLYDVTVCPADKSTSTLDFGAPGIEQQVEHLVADLSEVCAKDAAWVNYDTEWTLEGGGYATACGLFGMYGQAG